MSLKQVIDVINRYDKFLITSHKDPEGDCLGSGLALASLLRRKKKEVCFLNESPIPETYKFLPRINRIIRGGKKINFDAAIILDSPNMERIGRAVNFISGYDITVNIDHHISNERFADVNWVDPTASSVGEMVFSLFKKLGCEVASEEALCLYVAILTDTGSFRYSNTNPRTHNIVAQLLKHDLNPEEIYQRIYANSSFAEAKLLGLSLATLRRNKNGKVIWFRLTQDALAKIKRNLEQVDNFINVARSIKGVKVIALFKEIKKNEIRVSLRSNGEVDVNRIANFFGGGGHKTASGCTIYTTIDKAERLVLKRIRQAIRR